MALHVTISENTTIESKGPESVEAVSNELHGSWSEKKVKQPWLPFKKPNYG